jgi:heat shock protein HspQ
MVGSTPGWLTFPKNDETVSTKQRNWFHVFLKNDETDSLTYPPSARPHSKRESGVR